MLHGANYPGTAVDVPAGGKSWMDYLAERGFATAQAQTQAKLVAYRVVSREQALARWLMGVPDDKKASLIPSGWFDK